jgi:hypothetical protein
MKLVSKITVAGAAIGLVASAALAERQIVTPSGQVDAIFRGTSIEDAGSKIANQCMNAGWSVTNQTNSQITCEFQMGFMQSVLTQMLIGNSYSTTPRGFVRFNIARIGDNTRTQANAWVETQMAFGQMRQNPLNNDKTHNDLMGFLMSLGAEPPPGSRMPGVYIGFDGDPVQQGRTVVIPVTRVYSGAPGVTAGLQLGDSIYKVNGATFRNLEDFRKKLNRVALGNRYPIVVLREGKELSLILTAVERPAFGTPEMDALVELNRAPVEAAQSIESTVDDDEAAVEPETGEDAS